MSFFIFVCVKFSILTGPACELWPKAQRVEACAHQWDVYKLGR